MISGRGRASSAARGWPAEAGVDAFGSGAMLRFVCFFEVNLFVIAGCAIWRRPGFHNPGLWLWIPVSGFARFT